MKTTNNVCMMILCFMIGLMLCKIANMMAVRKAKKQDKITPNVLVYGTMECPYTVKQIESFDQYGIGYDFKDTSNKMNHKELVSITQDPNSGVPVTANPETNKYRIGYLPANKLVDMLK